MVAATLPSDHSSSFASISASAASTVNSFLSLGVAVSPEDEYTIGSFSDSVIGSNSMAECKINDERIPSVLPINFNVTPHLELLTWACNCTGHNSTAPGVDNFFCSKNWAFHEWWVSAIYYFMFGSIVLLAVGGNLTVIWIVLAHKRMRTVTNYFLLNLAISDVSISIFNVCFSFIFNFYYTWWFGEVYCIFSNFMGVVPTCASVFTLMSMSLDRYVAIMHPLRRRLSQKKTIAIIILIWLAAGFCGLPMILYSHTDVLFYLDGGKQILCKSDKYPDGTAQESRLFSIYNNFLLVVNYLLPLVVLFITYLRIGRELWGSQTIGEHKHEENMKAKRKVVKMMLAVVAIFMICWLPYHIYFTLLMKKLSDMEFHIAQYIYLNMYWLAMSSTIVNPIIYCWMNSKFRIGFKYAFRFIPCISMSKEEYLRSELARGARTTANPNSDMSYYSRVPSSTRSKTRAQSRLSQNSTTGIASNGLGPNYRCSTTTTIYAPNGRTSRESDFDNPSDFSPTNSHVMGGSPTQLTTAYDVQNGNVSISSTP